MIRLLACLCLLAAFPLCAGNEAVARSPVVVVRTSSSGFVAANPGGSTISAAPDAVTVINAAIAGVAQSGGGTVLLTAGTYTINSPIEVKTGIRLVGEGGLLTDPRPADHYPTVLRAGKPGMLAVVNMFEARGSRLEHLEVDGAGLADNCVKSAGYAIRIRDCVIRNGARRGVWVTAGKDSQHDSYVQATLINCLVDQGGRGIGVDVSSDPAVRSGGFTDGTVFKCRILNAGETGVTLAGGWQFLHNRVSCAARLGSVRITGGFTMVTENEIESAGLSPALLVSASNTTITGNRFRCAGGGSAIELAGGCRVMTITRNTCAGAEARPRFFIKSASGQHDALAVFDNCIGECAAVSNLKPPGNWYCERNVAETQQPPNIALGDALPRDQTIGATVYLSGGKCVAEDAEGRGIASAADAATVINAAIGHAATRGSGAVLVRAGTYAITAPICMKPGSRLAGEGGMNSAGTGFRAYGTVLQATPSCKTVVVDMADATGARLEQLVVDGNHVAATCVKMAGRDAGIGDCFIGQSVAQAVWIANGNDLAPNACSGMVLADTLIHAGTTATCLVVTNDPSAKGPLPANGIVINSRLKMGRIQAIFAGGPGWRYLGNHATSGAGSVFGIEVKSADMRMAGNYFDTVARGARLRLTGRNLVLEGNHFQKTPGAFSAVLIDPASSRTSIVGNTWNSRPGPTTKSFLEFLGQAPSDLCVLGNVGKGTGAITNVRPATNPFRCEGNSLQP